MTLHPWLHKVSNAASYSFGLIRDGDEDSSSSSSDGAVDGDSSSGEESTGEEPDNLQLEPEREGAEGEPTPEPAVATRTTLTYWNGRGLSEGVHTYRCHPELSLRFMVRPSLLPIVPLLLATAPRHMIHDT
jgi:hypothetical protein